MRKKWKLDELTFGFLQKGKNKPIFLYYDPESLSVIKNLWNCMLLFRDIKRIHRDIEKNPLKFQIISFLKKYHKGLKSTEFSLDLNKLLKSFNLSPIWHESILLLLLTGYFFPPQKFFEILCRKDKSDLEMYISIYPETKFDDIRYHWNEIKKLKEEIFGINRTKISKDFEKYIEIYQNKKNYDQPYSLLIGVGS